LLARNDRSRLPWVAQTLSLPSARDGHAGAELSS
jgi:hypothetical protein